MLNLLANFADKYKAHALPGVHPSAARPADDRRQARDAVDERAATWTIDELEYRLSSLQLLGSKGTTGTQASFMELFGGDERESQGGWSRISPRRWALTGVVPVSGQTYSRKMDYQRGSPLLAGIAQSASKFATTCVCWRIFKEMEEPFEKSQIGSSAMPYKRNPMRCERICALARYVMRRQR